MYCEDRNGDISPSCRTSRWEREFEEQEQEQARVYS